MAPATIIQEIRIFSATWNVGGKTPSHGLNLEDFLKVECSSDIYVLGFQEIVPLSTGNVLAMEDKKPALKWQALISHALNKSYHDCLQSSSSSCSGSFDSKITKSPKTKIFHKTSLKVLSKNLRADSNYLKACNCSNPRRNISLPEKLNYQIIASKQMVGVYLTIWARVKLVKDIGHLRIYCMGRGIMGCLGNKGCISISLTLHQTSFCFMCCHLASGEKDEDQLRRNSDVAQILKNTRFSSCKNKKGRIPERILDHNSVIWLGDLNYRVALSYEETRRLLEENDWNSLLEKDQLNTVREAGDVFKGWNEGKIHFAPTYKYSHNSDYYVGETANSKKKRRTPSWCDRILWRGNGIKQLAYERNESKFSDHRPVCAFFAAEVETKKKSPSKFMKGFLLHKHKNGIYTKNAYVPQPCLVCSI